MKYFQQVKKYMTGSYQKYVAGPAFMFAATAAMAAPVELDVSDVVAQIGKGITAVSAIAVAILSIYGVAKCYALVKKAF